MNMTLTTFFQTLAFAGVTALIAVIYKNYLLAEPLHWFLRWGERWERRWFFKPVWGCPKCIAGQLALWLYFFQLPNCGHYSFLGHVFAICASIFIAEQIQIFLNKQNQ